jgi:hypothetical protein
MIGTTNKPLVELSPDQEYFFNLVGFEPHPEQRVILACDKRFVLVAGGAQAGKSVTASAFLMSRLADDLAKNAGQRRQVLYWLVAADYERTRAEFDYLVDYFVAWLGKDNVQASKRVDPGYIHIQTRDEIDLSIRIETKSAKDPRTLAMRAPHGILGCEASQLDVPTMERIMSRVAPMRGWVFLSGTFEGSLGWYPQLWRAWKSGAKDRQSCSLPAWSNTHLYPGGRNDPEILRLERESSDQFFMERIAGEPVPPRGIVFKEFRADLHVKPVEYEPGQIVYLWEDPGYGSEHTHAVMVAHIIDGQVRVFDEVYERDLITEDIIDLCRNKEWWREYDEGRIVLVTDPHYKTQHHSMTSVMECWMKETGLYARGDKLRIQEGTERLKGFLKPDPIFGEPKIVFSSKCKGILSEFGAEPNPFDGQTKAYCWKTDRDGNIIGTTPDDKHNDAIKATIYGIVDFFGYGYTRSGNTIKMKRWA